VIGGYQKCILKERDHLEDPGENRKPSKHERQQRAVIGGYQKCILKERDHLEDPGENRKPSK
jgi:hypothetical protein